MLSCSILLRRIPINASFAFAAQAALVLIDAALLQRSRLGGSVSTVCDGSTNFEPPKAADAGDRKRARGA